MIPFNSNLSIVVPLKGRSQYTKRWLEYAKFINLPYKIILADGSKDNENEKVYQNMNYGDLNLDYIKFPEDKSWSHYYKKMNQVIQAIDTPFVMTCDNDDFLFLEGINFCLKEATTLKDFSSISGQVHSANLKNPNKLKFIKNFYHHYESILHEDPLERICHQIENYRVTFYDIYPTHIAKMAFSAWEKANLENIFMAEILLSLNFLALGKLYKFQNSYLLRQTDSSGSSANDSKNVNTYIDWSLNPNWSLELCKFKQAIKDILNQYDPEVDKKIENALKVYFLKKVKKGFLPHKTNLKNRLKIHLDNYFLKDSDLIMIKNFLQNNHFYY